MQPPRWAMERVHALPGYSPDRYVGIARGTDSFVMREGSACVRIFRPGVEELLPTYAELMLRARQFCAEHMMEHRGPDNLSVIPLQVHRTNGVSYATAPFIEGPAVAGSGPAVRRRFERLARDLGPRLCEYLGQPDIGFTAQNTKAIGTRNGVDFLATDLAPRLEHVRI